MADKSIGELTAATQVNDADLFVMEQSGAAKKLTGAYLASWLATLADGHGGIQSIEKTSTSGLVDTYTITYATLHYENGVEVHDTDTFTVTNGEKGDTGDTWYTIIKYSSVEPTQDSDMGDEPGPWMGVYYGEDESPHYDDYTWYEIKGNTGDPAELVSSVVEYQAGGSSIPSDTWSSTIPDVVQGGYLWTRTTMRFNNGNPVVTYTASRQGRDGTGTPSDSTPLKDTTSGSAGTGTGFSRDDHQHPTPFPYAISANTGTYMVFFGDSWTVGTTGVTSRFSTRLASKFGKTEKNYGYNGAGFRRPGNALMSNQITTALSDMTEAERNDTAYVVVVAGVNDFRWQTTDSTNTTNFAQAVESFLDSCHTYFPNAVIVAGLCNSCQYGFPPEYQHWIAAAQRNASQNLNFPLIIVQNVAESINGNPDNFADDPLHPNDTGHSNLAAHLMKGIMGGGTEVDYYVNSIQLESGVSITNDTKRYVFKSDHKFYIRPMRLSFTSTSTSKTLGHLNNAGMAPAENTYYPAYLGDAIIGTVCITSSGNLVLTPTSSVSGCWTPLLEWEMDRGLSADEKKTAV